MLAGRELLEPDALERFAVVPFGVRTEPPQRADPPVMRGPLVPEDARVLLWGGGIWDWLDAPTVIRADAPACPTTSTSSSRASSARRCSSATSTRAARRRRSRSPASSGWRARVHFNHDWVPYEQRGAWLLEADLGVSAHPAHLETRFAYRTRIADYLWAGLPVVTSAGDVLGDHVATRGLGRAVAPGDDAGLRRTPAPSCSPIPGPPASRSRRRRTSCAGTASCSRCLTSAIPAQNAHTIDTGRVPYAAPPSANMHRSPLETLTTDGPATLTRKLATNARRVLKRA